MSAPVFVLGIGAEGVASLRTRAREILDSATFVAGGRRHLEIAGCDGVETFPITNNIEALVDRLRHRGPAERCVVLASGDPLFYGIGDVLSRSLGGDDLVVIPHLSSMQLAFARAGLSWNDAAVGSVHGRPLPEALLPLLGRPKIGLFTQDGRSPAAIARFFLERGLADYEALVAENLDARDERLTRCPLSDLVGHQFGDLNVVILTRNEGRRPDVASRIACVPDVEFSQPAAGPVLLTHAEVRAIVLARFHGIPEGPLWDIGAGLGGVSVGLARTFPEREVVAVERSREQLSYLETNRRKFAVPNLRIVEGYAPDCLANEARPAGVFVGGTGGQLDAILDVVLDRLHEGGPLVASFVTLENLSRCVDRLREAGSSPEVTQVAISHGKDLAGLTSLVPLRPVWVIRAVRRSPEDRDG